MQIMNKLTLILLAGVLAMQPCLGMKDVKEMKSYGLKNAARWHEIRLKLEFCQNQKFIFDALSKEQKTQINDTYRLATDNINSLYTKQEQTAGSAAATSSAAQTSEQVFTKNLILADKIFRAFKSCQQAFFDDVIGDGQKISPENLPNIYDEFMKDSFKTSSSPCDKLIINKAFQVMQAKFLNMKSTGLYTQLKYYVSKSKKLDKRLADLIIEKFNPKALVLEESVTIEIK